MSRFAHIFILTGAGISAESGLGTFRDTGGVWSRFSWEELATPQGYARNPQRVLDFYNARRTNLLAASPNPAHTALARLAAHQAAGGRQLTLVTQNVDDLHERAGSPDVIHMHGELLAGWCVSCGWRGHWAQDMPKGGGCPACGDDGQLRPDVVWFGEMPYQMDLIGERLMLADLFVSIGTSGSVYPAAGFVDEARRLGIPRVEINLEPSDNGWMFDRTHHGPASTEVPGWVDALIAGSW